jgi:hypothetical protein
MTYTPLFIGACLIALGLESVSEAVVPVATPAPVSSRVSLGAAAGRIDAVLADAARDAGQSLPATIDDAGFARRLFLDTLGRIPTVDELDGFLADKAGDKRARLAKELLESPGHGSRMFHFWADLLRARTKLARKTSGDPFMHFIRQAIHENQPYDEMVAEMLTAEGPAHAPGNGATGYLMRDLEMPEDSMSNTMRVFLGTAVECAQCHDHPFDEWTRKQYYEMVAFTGGLEYKLGFNGLPAGERYKALLDDLRDEHGKGAKRAFERVFRPVYSGIVGSGTSTVQLPSDYQYDDAEPLEWVSGRNLFDGEPGPEPEFPESDRSRKRNRPKKKKIEPVEVHSREALAEWVTSPDNPRFTSMITNRLWKLVMGRALIEPLDDWKADTESILPQLSVLLDELMLELDYDVRAFLSVLLRTQAYQREAWVGSSAVVIGSRVPTSPELRRLSAEQVWDSLLTLVVPDLDGTLAGVITPEAEDVYAKYEEVLLYSDAEARDRVKDQLLRYTNRSAYDALRAEQNAERKAARYDERDLVRQLKKELRRGNREAEQLLLDRLSELGIDSDTDLRPRSARRSEKELLRASELVSPAPADHLLRVFGQSDREHVETAHVDANVPQVLELLNGFIEEHLLTNRDAVLPGAIRAVSGSGERIAVAYRGVLGRDPTSAELALWLPEVRQDNRAALRDLMWVLVNSHEFLFQR